MHNPVQILVTHDNQTDAQAGTQKRTVRAICKSLAYQLHRFGGQSNRSAKYYWTDAEFLSLFFFTELQPQQINHLDIFKCSSLIDLILFGAEGRGACK